MGTVQSTSRKAHTVSGETESIRIIVLWHAPHVQGSPVATNSTDNVGVARWMSCSVWVYRNCGFWARPRDSRQLECCTIYKPGMRTRPKTEGTCPFRIISDFKSSYKFPTSKFSDALALTCGHARRSSIDNQSTSVGRLEPMSFCFVC